MDVDPEEYSKLSFDIHNYPVKENILDRYKEFDHAFPRLQELDKKEGNRLFRYIILLHDKHSPVIKNYPDLERRKKEAALLAGYTLEKHEQRLSEIYNHEDTLVAESIFKFLKYQDQKAFTLLAISEEVFWQAQEKLIEPLTNSKSDKDALNAMEVKVKLIEKSDEILQKIEGYKNKIFGGDKELEDIYSGYSKYTPESIADQLP